MIQRTEVGRLCANRKVNESLLPCAVRRTRKSALPKARWESRAWADTETEIAFKQIALNGFLSALQH